MDKTPLNDSVRIVCEEYWDGTNIGCGQCAIRAACHSSPTVRLTHEAMEDWRLRFNEAAIKYLETRHG